MKNSNVKYRCIKGWPRHKVGDIVEAYEYFRIPSDIRSKHFVEVSDTKSKVIKSSSLDTKKLNVKVDDK